MIAVVRKLSGAFALAAAAALTTGCTKHEPPADPVRPVLAQRVAVGQKADPTVYSGEVRARYETDLAFRTAGKIVSRSVELGSEVKKGQPLARVDPTDAALSASAARAQVAAAQTQFNFARAELERYKTLLAQGFVGQSAYDAKLSTYNSAKASLDAARAQAAVSGNQSAYTTLTAENAGVITMINAEPGQVVSAGQAVFKLARPEELEVLISAPESRLAELQAARQVAVRLWAVPEKVYLGRIREISPNADAATRTFGARVTIVDAGPEVRLGMTANVLIGGNETRVTTLPLTAVYSQDGKAHVWVVDGKSGQVALRPVKVAQINETGVSVLEGLADGEVIVTQGVHKLIAGQKVKPLIAQASKS